MQQHIRNRESVDMQMIIQIEAGFAVFMFDNPVAKT
jgi:hypothetical protein